MVNDIENNLESLNDSYIGLRYDILKFISGSNKLVLDVGCATGVNGKYLLDNSIAQAVYGIENNSTMAFIASNYYTNVQTGDIDKMNLSEIYGSLRFDFIMVGDVLEHLYDPWNTLKNLVSLLNRDGKIVLSIPNFQHIDVFIHVFIKGIYPYNERGIFDKTHVRFFTWNNILEILDKSSLKIIDTHRNFRYRDKIESKFPFYGKLLKSLLKNYYTFQYVVLCERR